MWPNLPQKLSQELMIATSFIYYLKIFISTDVGYSNWPLRDWVENSPTETIQSQHLKNTTRHATSMGHIDGTHFCGKLYVGPILGFETILGMCLISPKR